ncbi:hypothetical protein G5B30_16495 [Sphingobacterium sp. SGG-5]|uniref:hypothetical protein n=1 Tax=Sphingobacterium sp. SGG-5 TaxID=2710881 RepID=UPI0013EA5CC7|nr:hypothetical protein [Sphingobacterium sp. SGG-5]NGM63510.1 hypothetical protein [Sphingobacterium sp. SGG-5]
MIAILENYLRDYPILLSVISGIVSSTIFLFVLSRLKPSIGICTIIAYDTKSNKYLLKIINKSLFFKVYDIQVHLYSICPIQTINSENFKIKPFELLFTYYSYWTLKNEEYMGVDRSLSIDWMKKTEPTIFSSCERMFDEIIDFDLDSSDVQDRFNILMARYLRRNY